MLGSVHRRHLMRQQGRRSPARVLAPLALLAFTIAVAAVVLASVGGGGDDGGESGTRPSSSRAATATAPSERPRRTVYIVKTGDTLGLIAQKTGVSVERLQELNPDLDPQALLSGQRIDLR
jgi:LysM repeat protein